jgi:hypothetical protein
MVLVAAWWLLAQLFIGLFGFLLQELEDEYGYYSRTNQNEQLLDFWMNRKCK